MWWHKLAQSFPRSPNRAQTTANPTRSLFQHPYGNAAPAQPQETKKRTKHKVINRKKINKKGKTLHQRWLNYREVLLPRSSREPALSQGGGAGDAPASRTSLPTCLRRCSSSWALPPGSAGATSSSWTSARRARVLRRSRRSRFSTSKSRWPIWGGDRRCLSPAAS